MNARTPEPRIHRDDVPGDDVRPLAPERAWALSEAEVLGSLGVDRASGLSPGGVLRQRQIHGFNRLRETERRSALRLLAGQLTSPIVWLLATASGVAAVFDEQIEALAIGVVLVVNSALGFWTERRAARAVEALRQLGQVCATVRRGGEARVIPAAELVPGDIVLFEAGDILTADLRILAASRLQADESALTGESLAVDKSTSACPDDAPLSERRSMLHKGTAVTRGGGEGVVVATGMATELGQISRLVEDAEPEATPLEARLDQLGRRLIYLTLAISALVAGVGIARGRELYLSIEIALALAVAAVPEGLPIVATVALARGMWRMARRHALVERLSAVETLGSTSILLVDKTGTLTENRMAVAEVALSDGRVTTHLESQDPLLRSVLTVAALCNNAELSSTESDGSEGLGDPTEVALLIAGRRAGLERKTLLAASPEIAEWAFDSDAKRMATLHARDGAVMAAIKGAPEAILPICSHRVGPDGAIVELDDAARAESHAHTEEMASRGQRVLALATRTVPTASDFGYEGLTFLGLVGLSDPPRAGVRRAIDDCQAAGIRVVMVTGDHGGTAWRIAEATGLTVSGTATPGALIDANALPAFDSISEVETKALLQATVIARATPRQKIELVRLFQRSGYVVAMTGDGVNDAPALKQADIGVAMGRRGTQVAREAADMILQDDELRTIVEAVAQGRAIFANIQKFVLYLLGCNLSEILAVAVASFAEIPLPLLPLQILFLNLVTDVFPAFALGVGEGAPSLMSQRPRPPHLPLIERRQWMRIFGFGTLIAMSVLGSLMIATEVLGKSDGEATTISFLTLALAQLWHVFNMREARSHVLRNEITQNHWIWIAILVCLALIGLAVHLPDLAVILSLDHPGPDGWGLAFSMSLLPLVVGQIGLALRARKRPPEIRDTSPAPRRA
jgi:Ca2+-transporting ATPase